MTRLVTSSIAILALTLSIGCGKKEEAKEEAPKAATEEPEKADDNKDEAKPDTAAAAEGDKEPVICCEFNGATGTSTATKCAEFKGKVVPCKE